MGWRKISGSSLRATRGYWKGNYEVDYATANANLDHFGPDIKQQIEDIPRSRLYSALGSKDRPLDVSLASALAIDLLLEGLTTSTHFPSHAPSVPKVQAPDVPIKPIPFDEISEEIRPKVALMVVTATEKDAAMQRLVPLEGEDALLHTYKDANNFIVGRLGLVDIVLCYSEMGAVGRDSASLVTTEILNIWAPAAIIMAGIAFGRDASKPRPTRTLGKMRSLERVAPRPDFEDDQLLG